MAFQCFLAFFVVKEVGEGKFCLGHTSIGGVSKDDTPLSNWDLEVDKTSFVDTETAYGTIMVPEASYASIATKKSQEKVMERLPYVVLDFTCDQSEAYLPWSVLADFVFTDLKIRKEEISSLMTSRGDSKYNPTKDWCQGQFGECLEFVCTNVGIRLEMHRLWCPEILSTEILSCVCRNFRGRTCQSHYSVYRDEIYNCK